MCDFIPLSGIWTAPGPWKCSVAEHPLRANKWVYFHRQYFSGPEQVQNTRSLHFCIEKHRLSAQPRTEKVEWRPLRDVVLTSRNPVLVLTAKRLKNPALRQFCFCFEIQWREPFVFYLPACRRTVDIENLFGCGYNKNTQQRSRGGNPKSLNTVSTKDRLNFTLIATAARVQVEQFHTLLLLFPLTLLNEWKLWGEESEGKTTCILPLAFQQTILPLQWRAVHPTCLLPDGSLEKTSHKVRNLLSFSLDSSFFFFIPPSSQYYYH